jgi:hypothetical protein
MTATRRRLVRWIAPPAFATVLLTGQARVPASLAAPPDPAGISGTLADSLYYLPSKTTGRRLDWAEFKGSKRLAGEVRGPSKGSPGSALRVVNKTGIPRTYVLGIFETPNLKSAHYVVSGRMRYQKVAKQGYLEMWSVFPDGKQYFTRTLDDEGAMARIAGSSDWRDLALPFDATGADAGPSRLIVQLVLSANGAVDVGPLELKEMSENSR